MILHQIKKAKLHFFGAYYKTCLYKILNVSSDSPLEEIRQSYLKLVKLNHPDIAGGNELQ